MCGEYENARKAFAKLSGEFLFIVFLHGKLQVRL